MPYDGKSWSHFSYDKCTFGGTYDLAKQVVIDTYHWKYRRSKLKLWVLIIACKGDVRFWMYVLGAACCQQIHWSWIRRMVFSVICVHKETGKVVHHASQKAKNKIDLLLSIFCSNGPAYLCLQVISSPNSIPKFSSMFFLQILNFWFKANNELKRGKIGKQKTALFNRIKKYNLVNYLWWKFSGF